MELSNEDALPKSIRIVHFLCVFFNYKYNYTMQVTIYLSEEVIARIEALAKKNDKSRSAVIQEILLEGLQKRARGTPVSELLELFGSWKMTPKEMKEIRRIRGKDTRRARLQS